MAGSNNGSSKDFDSFGGSPILSPAANHKYLKNLIDFLKKLWYNIYTKWIVNKNKKTITAIYLNVIFKW